ncbi:MAG: T9SS type A sorting domain-containing protein [Flammeovirgaceae bacterium]|nr:T9SS type A sorting domain-containing protein [Flammeovirgaceae bacterium]
MIYEGVQVGKVTLKIYNETGSVLFFSETINSVEGFIRPINFKAMAAGVYTIEIADASGKRTAE